MNLPEPVQCFFCNQILIPFINHNSYKTDKTFYKAWMSKYGSINKQFAQIGKKAICQDCTADLHRIIG